jgi:hypothetical protein
MSLSIGGDSWAGFTFGSFGRARDWRLHTPAGETLTADELVTLRARSIDLAYLQARNLELESKLAGAALALTPDEAQLVRVALQVLTRELPIRLGRRDATVRPEMLLRLA